MDDHHDHQEATHEAKCGDPDCSYIAMTHAHDDDSAALALSEDLARHNKEEHGKDTVPGDIYEEVSAKMKVHS